jgi:hypothetical protein
MALPTSPENGNRSGETVQEVLPTNRAELTRTEAARYRDFAQELGHKPGVVVRRLEKLRTSPNAREQERRRRALARQCGHLALQGSAEVLVSGLRVAGVELHRLANIYFTTDDNGPAFGVRTDDAADEEISMALLAAVLVDHEAQMQAAIGKELAVPVGQFVDQFLEALVRRSPAELAHDISLCTCHGERVPDGPAPL